MPLVESYKRTIRGLASSVETFQDQIFGDVSDKIFTDVSEVTRDLLNFRKMMLAAREVLHELASRRSPYVSEATQPFLEKMVDTLEPETDAPLAGVVINNFFRSWGHRFVYDPQTLRHALTQAGFVDVEEKPLGELERHLAEAPEFNEYETFVLEAKRPAR